MSPNVNTSDNPEKSISISIRRLEIIIKGYDYTEAKKLVIIAMIGSLFLVVTVLLLFAHLGFAVLPKKWVF